MRSAELSACARTADTSASRARKVPAADRSSVSDASCGRATASAAASRALSAAAYRDVRLSYAAGSALCTSRSYAGLKSSGGRWN